MSGNLLFVNVLNFTLKQNERGLVKLTVIEILFIIPIFIGVFYMFLIFMVILIYLMVKARYFLNAITASNLT